MVLSGPYGIGKTCFSYLIACYAWVNKYPLIYIVRCFALFVIKKQAKCGNWTSQYKDAYSTLNGPATYWLKQFKLLNNDMLTEIEGGCLIKEILENDQSPLEKQDNITAALKKMNTPVVC